MFSQRVFIFLSLFSSLSICSQELTKDEIFQLSFDSIVELENELEYGTVYSKKVFDTHILKAKYLKDTAQLAEAYRKRVWGEEFDTAIQYVDSAIFISRNLTDESLKSRIHYSKGVLLYEGDKPQESLKEYIAAYEFAVKANNYEYIIDCLNSISGLKREYAQEQEAILLHQKSLEYLNRYGGEIDNYDLTYLITLDNISRCYLEVRNLDSAKIHVKKGKELALKMDDEETYNSLSILDAQINYYDRNYLKSRDSLLKYINYTNGYSKADALYYLGMIEGKLGNLERKRDYFLQIDSILETNGFPLIDNVKETFQFLLKDAIQNNEKGSESKYINRLVFYDSLLGETERHIRNVTLKEFDLPLQKNIEQQMKNKFHSEKSRMFYIFILLLGLSLLLFLTYYRNYRKLQKKLKAIMNEKIEPLKSSPSDKRIAEMEMPMEAIENTLEKLNEWEDNLGYLEPEINQNSLSKTLNTNSSYLSKVVNTYKNQNFSNYLKDLRITYAINYIKDNPKFLENRSTIQVAEHFGFGSLDVFVRALKRKIGVTPAAFFRQIKKSNL